MCKLSTELPLIWKSLGKTSNVCIKMIWKHIWSLEVFEITNFSLIYAIIDQDVFHRKVEQKLVFVKSKIWKKIFCFNNNVHSKTAREYTKAFNPSLLTSISWRQLTVKQSLTQSIVQDETTREYTKAFNPSPLISTIESWKKTFMGEKKRK